MTRARDEDIKIFVKQVGILFDAWAKTLEINLKAYIDAAIKASEDRLRKELVSKEDIKDMATKFDIARLERKIDETKSSQRQIEELKARQDHVEEELIRVKSRN